MTLPFPHDRDDPFLRLLTRACRPWGSPVSRRSSPFSPGVFSKVPTIAGCHVALDMEAATTSGRRPANVRIEGLRTDSTFHTTGGKSFVIEDRLLVRVSFGPEK